MLQEAGIGARSNAVSSRTPSSQSRHVERFTVPGVVGQSSSAPSFSAHWMQQLTLQVGDLLRLAELEIAACMVVAAKALATWSAVTEQYQAQRLIKDSVHASLLEEMTMVKDMATREKRRAYKPPRSLLMLPDYADLSEESSGSPTIVKESISQMQPMDSVDSDFVDLTTNSEFCTLESDSLSRGESTIGALKIYILSTKPYGTHCVPRQWRLLQVMLNLKGNCSFMRCSVNYFESSTRVSPAPCRG
jgi:hypothetical protein